MARRPSARALLPVSCLVLVVTSLLGCSKKEDSSSKDCRTIKGPKATLVARNVAWDTRCLRAKPGTIAFTVRNEDSGVRHNLRVSGNGVNQHTKLENGPTTQTLSVTLGRPGRYSFVCDIHSNMEGTLTIG